MHGFRGPRVGAPRRGVALLAAALIVGGCAGAVPGAAGGGGPGPGGGSPVGRTFLSESVTEGGQPRPLVPGTRVELSFTDDGQVTASAGCNTMFGPVEVGPHRLIVGDLGSTDMACAEEREAQDEWLAGVLTAEPAYALRGDRLRISTGGTVIRLVDRAVAEPDRPLEGTVWRLDSIVEGDMVSTVPAGTGATLTFGGGGVQVQVEGCNRGTGRVAVRSSELDVGPLAMTRRACEPAPTRVEGAVTAVLNGTIAYSVHRDTLTLSHPSGRGLMLRAEA